MYVVRVFIAIELLLPFDLWDQRQCCPELHCQYKMIWHNCRANTWHVALGKSDLFETRANTPTNYTSNHCFYCDTWMRQTVMVPVVNLLDSIPVCMISMHLPYNIQYCKSSHQKQNGFLYILFSICRKWFSRQQILLLHNYTVLLEWKTFANEPNQQKIWPLIFFAI